jgi:5-methylcytosine-specific restriction endonuclease McrA
VSPERSSAAQTPLAIPGLTWTFEPLKTAYIGREIERVMTATTYRQCPTCRHVIRSDLLRQHRQDEHGAASGSRQWKADRQATLTRDGHRCTVCGAPASEVHHVDGAQAQTPDDLETRCRQHNPRGIDHLLSPFAGRWRVAQ